MGGWLSLPHHHVTQPEGVIEPLQLLVLSVPLHQALRHLTVLPLVLIRHLGDGKRGGGGCGGGGGKTNEEGRRCQWGGEVQHEGAGGL